MDRLWAPWRGVYVVNKSGTECIFCEKLNAGVEKDFENYVLYRGDNVFALLNIYPYNNGHLMVVPNRHVGEIEELKLEEMQELFTVIQLMVRVQRSALSPDGFNVGMNLGKVAGAGIPGHLHIHIVPRWGGDTNFMPVLADVRVIPEGLEATYAKLKQALERIV
ncbi:AP-4-A phosphorylase [Sporotomaculum syntrophicum]|uniref:AP-4-A phosphorylase n=1 Tax=Sporotomaculum syntrophicum TaxID=182264 RepID=A0A9D2WSD8_9FIRM|nr:HIT domain-containing protein [Sporotomaculum syntrophicum]KAF1086223.1 AP-4-A phosphorylase [Sporotomaculum syntrophicum]